MVITCIHMSFISMKIGIIIDIEYFSINLLPQMSFQIETQGNNYFFVNWYFFSIGSLDLYLTIKVNMLSIEKYIEFFFQLKCQTFFLYSNTPPTLPMALKIICISLHVPQTPATNWVFSWRKNNTFREMSWCNPKHLNFSWGFDFQHDLDCNLFLLLVLLIFFL